MYKSDCKTFVTKAHGKINVNTKKNKYEIQTVPVHSLLTSALTGKKWQLNSGHIVFASPDIYPVTR
jgi:hypothetical protein